MKPALVYLRSVYTNDGEPRPEVVFFLYRLLSERPAEANISHAKMPSMDEHVKFVRSMPYRYWGIVSNLPGRDVGAVYVTEENEVGVAIAREYQRQGYAEAALRDLLRAVDPLPALAGKRRGAFIANVAPANQRSHALFQKLGGRPIEITYELPRGGKQ